MLMRFLVTIIILISICLGFAMFIFPREQLANIIMLRDFFETILAPLACAALIKYLFSR